MVESSSSNDIVIRTAQGGGGKPRNLRTQPSWKTGTKRRA